LPQEIALAFIFKSPYLGSNTSQIKCHFKHLKCISQENNDHKSHLFQQKKPKFQHVGLEKMSIFFSNDATKM
jgi:hypothetical protein